MRISLTGNPNSGKTTFFNEITNKVERVGNWGGVTIEKKEAKLKRIYNPQKEDIIIADLPGAYSMSAYTSEEEITSDFMKNDDIDVIINIVDSSNLNRSLFMTTELLELGIPLVIALNKKDIIKKQEDIIDIKKLYKSLGVPIIFTVATTKEGIKEVIIKAIELADNKEISKVKTNVKDKNERYDLVNKITNDCLKQKVKSSEEKESDKWDRFIAHKWLGIIIFALVMWLVFTISQIWIGPYFSGIIDSLIMGGDFLEAISFGIGSGWEIAGIFGGTESLFVSMNVNDLLASLVLNGIIGGVGAIVGFLPLIMVLFFFLSLLEDSGYMARVALVMDRYFKKIGLAGKSLIPMYVGTACAIPAVMSARTIKNEKQRRMTILLTPFVPCGAKLPVIALFVGVFFVGHSYVSALMYFISIIVILLVGLLIKVITGAKYEEDTYFMIELPNYKLPSLKSAWVITFDRAKLFIIKAGTIILISNVVIWFLQTYGWDFQPVAENAGDTSMLATIATPIAFLLIPLGFGIWQLTAAAVTGFIAKENVVATLAVLFLVSEEALGAPGSSNVLITIGGLTAVSSFAYVLFNLYTPPCFAAIGAMRTELKSTAWLLVALSLQLGVGYLLALVVYQIGTVIAYGELGSGFIASLVVLALAIIGITYLIKLGKQGKGLANIG